MAARFLGLGAVLEQGDLLVTHWLRDIATYLNLAPTNTRYAGIVLRWGWVLVITNLRPLELVGLAFYCLAFPILALFYLLFRRVLGRVSADQTVTARHKGLLPPKRASHSRAILTLLLTAWFLLYGDSSVRVQLLLGSTLAVALFLSFAARAFLGARPAGEDDTAVFPRLENIFLAFASQLVKGKPPDSKAELWFLHSVHEPARNACRRLTLFIRGRRGRHRISAIVLADYILSLLVLLITSILAWVLVHKAVLAPATARYESVLRHTLAHFFSGLSLPQRSDSLPLWLDFGPSATAFVLFVLFIGPAGSLLPIRQQAYIARVTTSYCRLRRITLVISKYLRASRKYAERLPTLK